MTAVELKEYEAQYFGFTPHGFINFYFNDLVNCWTKIVDEIIIPRLVNFAGKPVALDAIQALRSKLTCRLFQHGRLEILLNEGQKYLSNNVFNIPNPVTLPDDENKLVGEYDEPVLIEKINNLSQEIIELQLQLKAKEAKRRADAVKSALAECLTAPEFADMRQLLDAADGLEENVMEDASMEL